MTNVLKNGRNRSPRLVAVLAGSAALLLVGGIAVFAQTRSQAVTERHVTTLPFPGIEEITATSDVVTVAEYVGTLPSSDVVEFGDEDEGVLPGESASDIYSRMQFRVVEPLAGPGAKGDIIEVLVLSGISENGGEPEAVYDDRFREFQQLDGTFQSENTLAQRSYLLFLNESDLIEGVYESRGWGIPRLGEDEKFEFPHSGLGASDERFDLASVEQLAESNPDSD